MAQIVTSAHQPNLIAGMWKFREENSESKSPVSTDDLIGLAFSWNIESPGRYRYLHVRGCGTQQIGIGFMYELKPGESMWDYRNKLSDDLKRQFGNDLIGWDISDEVYTIKT